MMRLTIETLEDRDKVIEYVKKLHIDSKNKYLADIKKKRKIRSINQNSLYWLWLKCIWDETGNHKDTLHDYFAKKYLGQEQIMIFGKYPVSVNKTTTALDTKQFTDYLERIQQEALTELDICLPQPKDRHWDEFYDRYKSYI